MLLCEAHFYTAASSFLEHAIQAVCIKLANFLIKLATNILEVILASLFNI